MFWDTVDMEPGPIRHSVLSPLALGMDARHAIQVVCHGAPVSNASKIRFRKVCDIPGSSKMFCRSSVASEYADAMGFPARDSEGAEGE